MGTLLSGKRALVTGAGRGIGPAIVAALASEGASVALACFRSRSAADELAQKLRADGVLAVVVCGDLRDPEDAKRVVDGAAQQLGGIDILVNNASGYGPLGPLAGAGYERVRLEFDDVVAPVVNTTDAALPWLRQGVDPVVVTLAATLPQRPASGEGVHAMAKGAVLAWSRSLAHELGPEGIRVNCVSPGMALTEFSLSLPVERREALASKTPLRRLAGPDDVAGAVVLLCSGYAGFVTGANIAADGGLSGI